MGGGLGTTHGAAVFVCRWVLLWGGALEQHTGPQCLFAGGCCCGGGPWNNTRGRGLCLQVGVVVWGGPWNNTRGRSLCLQVKHKVTYKALSIQHHLVSGHLFNIIL